MIETAALGESRAVATAATELTKNTSKVGEASPNDFQMALLQAGEEAERAATLINTTALPLTEQEKEPETAEVLETQSEPIPVDLLMTLTVTPLPAPPVATTESAALDSVASPAEAPQKPTMSAATQTELEPATSPLPLSGAGTETVESAPTEPLEKPHTMPMQSLESKEIKGKGDTLPSSAPPEPTLAGATEVSPPIKPGASTEATAALPRPVTPRELPQQLAYFAQRVGEGGKTELHVRLDPPALGNIEVVLEHGRDGIAIRIVAQTQETLLLLQNQRTPLYEELSRQNLSLGSFSASLAGDTGGQRSGARSFAPPSPVSFSQRAPSALGPLTTIHLPARLGGLDARA